MVNKNDEDAFNGLTHKWALLAGLCSLPLFFFFAHLGDPGRGRAASICAVITMIAIRACWEFRKQLWFWATVACTTGVQIALVLMVPWNDRSYPGITLLPLALVDYALVYGCIKLVSRF